MREVPDRIQLDVRLPKLGAPHKNNGLMEAGAYCIHWLPLIRCPTCPPWPRLGGRFRRKNAVLVSPIGKVELRWRRDEADNAFEEIKGLLLLFVHPDFSFPGRIVTATAESHSIPPPAAAELPSHRS